MFDNRLHRAIQPGGTRVEVDVIWQQVFHRISRSNNTLGHSLLRRRLWST